MISKPLFDGRVGRVDGQDDALQVQDDRGDVFDDVLDRGELMADAVDLRY
ncbi:MAG: hypothetical protein MZU97_14160 [Bacillus subtilis]|nr:hypothetical protein [Bacillus subtilis]